MGIFKDAKASALSGEARKAREAGRSIFTPRLNYPATMHNLTGEIVDWSMMVAAVESEGWRLDQWSVGMDKQGRPEAYPLFRLA